MGFFEYPDPPYANDTCPKCGHHWIDHEFESQYPCPIVFTDGSKNPETPHTPPVSPSAPGDTIPSPGRPENP